MIAVAIGDERLVRRGIDFDRRRATELSRVETALRRTLRTDLQQEFSVCAELEVHAIGFAAIRAFARLAAADPDIALVVDIKTVAGGRHVVAAARADVPRADDIPLLVEFDDCRRGHTALA